MPARGTDPDNVTPHNPRRSWSIDHDSATPVYRQVAGILRDRITQGVWQPDRRLPSEPDLEAEFEISRDTVRRALDVLRDEGLIVTVKGRGSYVKPK